MRLGGLTVVEDVRLASWLVDQAYRQGAAARLEPVRWRDVITPSGSRPVRVGGRRFAIFNGATSPDRPRWRQSGRSLHFIASPDELEARSQDARFAASPHHGDRGWLAVRLDDSDAADWRESAELLESAYRVVAPRCPF